MKRLSLIAVLFFVCGYLIYAQNHMEALRYSQFIYGGTARSLAMGNAFGALGADFSSLSMNPAGIGLYKSSEFSFTPSIFVSKTSSGYMGNSNDDFKYNFNISNLGLVFTVKPKKESSDWKGIQIGFGMNRLANFNHSIMIDGANSEGSILDDYWAAANGIPYDNLDPFDTELAWNTYLLDTIGGPSDYFSAVPRGGVMQTKIIETRGSINEMALSVGGNFNDRLYLGATIGFPYLRYYENSTFQENDVADSITGFKESEFFNTDETDGSGFNFKLGLIYRIADWVRIGAAVHTPTFYNLKYRYTRKVDASFDDGSYYTDESPEGKFAYELNTPLRILADVAFVIGKHALISVDYEFVDYSDARLRSDLYMFSDENNVIRQAYTSSSNIRAGFEINLQPILLRGGYQLNMSPYKNDLNDGQRMAFSGGIGLRQKNYFVDMAYVFASKSEDYYLYPSNINAVTNKLTAHNILLTFGVKF